MTSLDPATEELLAAYPCLNAAGIAERCAQSDAAYANWRRVPLHQRTRHLLTIADALAKHKTDLAIMATREMGKPLAQALKEVEKCAAACRYYAREAEKILAPDTIETSYSKSYVTYQPLGPVLCIMPWNFPYWQVVRFAAPALAAGNTVLMKHAENTTGSALLLANVFHEAGIAEAAFQPLVITAAQVEQAIKHKAVRAVTLTGSERAGTAVASAAGSVLKKTVLELGGSDPYVVLADADLEQAINTCVEARLINNGQSCIAAKRFIVEESVYDRFVEGYVAAFKTKRVGPPMDPATDVGPLAKASILDGLEQQVQSSVQKGARPLAGGRRAKVDGGKGYYYEPTVLAGVTPGMAAFDEETFGPVAALIKAKDCDEALALANQSPYGLGAAVFSRDVERAEALAERHLDAGFCAVNVNVVSDPRLPFGGVKNSGYGRELAHVGMREFVNVKTVVIA